LDTLKRLKYSGNLQVVASLEQCGRTVVPIQSFPSSNFHQFLVSTLGAAKQRLGASDLTRGFARAFVLTSDSWNFGTAKGANLVRTYIFCGAGSQIGNHPWQERCTQRVEDRKDVDHFLTECTVDGS
jgi:hypothetical protein